MYEKLVGLLAHEDHIIRSTCLNILLKLNVSDQMHLRLNSTTSVYLRCYVPKRQTVGQLPIVRLYSTLCDRLKKEERPELVLSILRGLATCASLRSLFHAVAGHLTIFLMLVVRNRRILLEIDRSELITMLCRYLDNRVLGITRSSFVRLV